MFDFLAFFDGLLSALSLTRKTSEVSEQSHESPKKTYTQADQDQATQKRKREIQDIRNQHQDTKQKQHTQTR